MTPKTGPFCPECQKPATGNFCQRCGAKLGGRFCAQCAAKLSSGAAFCGQCGAATGIEKGAHRQMVATIVSRETLPWWLAGAAMFALIVFIGLSMVRPGPPGAPTTAGLSQGAGAPNGNPAAIDLSSMTPREAADRLYDRVMRSVAAGDSTSAQAFVPMAIGAYEQARPLDHDGLFHLSLLQRAAMDLEGALGTARSLLDDDPDHILGLVAAGQAAAEMGLEEDAAGYYARILEVYDGQVARQLPEYMDHAQVMNTVRDSAEAFLSRP